MFGKKKREREVERLEEHLLEAQDEIVSLKHELRQARAVVERYQVRVHDRDVFVDADRVFRGRDGLHFYCDGELVATFEQFSWWGKEDQVDE